MLILVTPAAFSSLGTCLCGLSTLPWPFVLSRMGRDWPYCRLSHREISRRRSSLSVGSPKPQKMISAHFFVCGRVFDVSYYFCGWWFFGEFQVEAADSVSVVSDAEEAVV